MTCPLEKKMLALLTASGLDFIRPERDNRDPTNLDFYLPALNLYIEVKQFHTPRLQKQLGMVPAKANVMVLQGMQAVEAFMTLCRSLSLTVETTQ